MHSERADDSRAGGYGERAETYLRLLAEAVLRQTGGNADEVYRAADTLTAAGALPYQVAGQIVADLQLALRIRRRPYPRQLGLLGGPSAWTRRMSALRAAQSSPWQVIPVGQAAQGSRLMALILMANRALAPATLLFPAAVGPQDPDIPLLTLLTGTDDLGTAYGLGFTGGNWAGSAWTGTVMFHPAPPAAARWLSIASPNGELLRADLNPARGADAAPSLAPEAVPESPGERLLTRQAEAMLAALALGVPSGHSPASVAGTVATLESAGVLSPLSPAPARLAALGQLLGLPLSGPADEVPARWTDVMAHYGRRRRLIPVTGTAAIGAALPDVDGSQFAVAGVHSGGAGTFLHMIVQRLPGIPLRRPSGPPVDSGFSLWLRDDAGGWHLTTVDEVSPVGGPEALLKLVLLPPLGHATASLTVELTGSAHRVLATLPVRW